MSASPVATTRCGGALERRFALDVRSLAAHRIGLGVVVTADALLRTRDLRLMFAADGMFPLTALHAYFADPWAWSLATAVDASWWGAVMLTVEGVAGCLLVAGCATRVATVIAWIAVVSILRRTAPATNAGDAWLACLLFWGMFLPLGEAWSWDGRRGGGHDDPGPSHHAVAAVGRPHRVCSVATAALVLQIALVYLAAGLAKWNDCWLSGEAIRHVLSVHDHGSPLGHALLAGGTGSRPLSWAVVALELLGPVVLVTCPGPRVRTILVVAFMLFHACCCLLLSVGLFGAIGLAAWLALLPGEVWDRLGERLSPGGIREAAAGPPRWIGTRLTDALCTVAGAAGLVSLVHDATACRDRPLPTVIRHAVALACLHQEWGMFGVVERQEQWVVARAELADGSVVDLLRGGRPFEAERPSGGFSSLPHHRWHKLFWNLPRPRTRVFAEPVAAALVRDWNARSNDSRRVVSLEIRYARLGRTAEDDTLHELLLATWPPRDAGGRGSLERILEADTQGAAP